MILKIILVLVIVAFIAVVINGVEDYNSHNRTNKLSFKESIDSLTIPIVTLFNNDKAFNFVVDTGANYSVINAEYLKLFDAKILKGITGKVYGINGDPQDVYYARIQLSQYNDNFVEEFQVFDIQSMCDNLKEENGVEIAGILGSSFFQRYKFIIDFNELNMYRNDKGNNQT